MVRKASAWTMLSSIMSSSAPKCLTITIVILTLMLSPVRGSDEDLICPGPCVCTSDNEESQGPGVPLVITQVSCNSKNLSRIPQHLPSTTIKLDLDRNGIVSIDDDNSGDVLGGLSRLKEVTIAKNHLSHFPRRVLSASIQILDLSYNRITSLDNHILEKLTKLHALNLGNNAIERVEAEAFVGPANLYILELNNNRLKEVPLALEKLRNLHELNLANNQILQIDTPFHDLLPRLIHLEIKANPIDWYHPQAFAHLKQLKKLILSDVKNITEFPHLNGTSSLEILRIDRCSLHYIPRGLCHFVPKLKNLDLKSNRIERLPDFQGCRELMILDVGLNEIQELQDGGFAELAQLHHLHLSHNYIQRLTAVTFQGLNQLRELDLSHNSIEEIEPEAFAPMTQLEDLNVGNNLFPRFPSEGLDAVTYLKIANNPNLKEFPGPESFPKARKLVLSYAYHCCQFTAYGLAKPSSLEPPIRETVYYPTDKEFDPAQIPADLWPGFGNFSHSSGISSHDFWKNALGVPLTTDPASLEEDSVLNSRELATLARDIKCIPLPGPFLPCNDLFDWWTLRCGVWVVFLLALMGNGTVVFVLIFARTKMDVPRFLVCNLAIADFFMGVYLGFLAVVDAATLGEFRKFAIPWQLSRGCQMAGFLGVLSSELSVYTLAVITMERHYAITHAMHLNKRLSLKHASHIMIVGWLFALLMAILPLFGISDYRKFAVCLPFETGDAVSMSYVVFLMFANGVAFTILMGCYLKMYCSIRGSQAWNSNDTRIAKRMALLVFTDLLCWFPIAFFSLTAVFGLQLVSLEEAKVFTVFILPLNSCCNPFLYAILTKQFKKDCVLICKAIEESRVTRGIGRCRHSSNFSNRQTAANTGSLVEKSSKDGQPCICHSGLHPGGGDENGNAKYRFIPSSERWNNMGPLGRFFSKYILCQNNSKEANRKARDDYRMRNVRRFLYNATPGNYPPETTKHHRHASVSSDNFSSSRSDSWRVQGRCGVPLRLLEPRRRNSWAVTRKPSQDSNLSSSRNDSSATSNSTATWRLSRSSVSSDGPSGGTKSSLRRSLAAAAATTHQQQVLPRAIIPSTGASINPHAMAHASGVGAAPAGVGPKPKLISFQEPLTPLPAILQQEEESPTTQKCLPECSSHPPQKAPASTAIVMPMVKPRTSQKVVKIQQPPQSTKSIIGSSSSASSSKRPNKGEEAEEEDNVIEDDELSAKIATNRPRLVRQSAFFSDEVIIEPEVCPVHGPLIPGTYDNEDEECSDIDEMEEDENGDITSPILKKSSPGPYSIALVIVPRRSVSSRGDSSSQFDPAQMTTMLMNPASTSEGAALRVMGGSSSPRSLTAAMADGGRRKLSDQPVAYYVLPPNATVLSRQPKWHSMSSVEVVQGETQPQVHAPSERKDPGESEMSEGELKGTEEDHSERRVSFQLPDAEGGKSKAGDKGPSSSSNPPA